VLTIALIVGVAVTLGSRRAEVSQAQVA